MAEQLAIDTAALCPPSSNLVQCAGTLVAIDSAGTLWVDVAPETRLACDLLHTGAALALTEGDPLLLVVPTTGGRGVVLGRIGRYVPPAPPRDLDLAASETLTLRCGEASLALHADGKVVLKGEDVLVRARGTHRVRAGTVSIN